MAWRIQAREADSACGATGRWVGAWVSIIALAGGMVGFAPVQGLATAPASPGPVSKVRPDEPEWVTRVDRWHDFERWHFRVGDRDAYVVLPDEAAPGRPWVWRARFPDYHPEMDIELLGLGFHVVYLDVAGEFGGPRAIQGADLCYAFVREHLQLAPRMALEGVSRGGLFVYRFALRYPDRVACIYADTPVLDFKSWPGGRGAGKGSAADWKKCLEAYGLTEAQAETFDGNPVDRAEELARTAIPLLHIVSLNDAVVPPAENSLRLRDALERQGGKLELILVQEGTPESQGHHFPHPAVAEVVEFIRRHAAADAGDR